MSHHFLICSLPSDNYISCTSLCAFSSAVQGLKKGERNPSFFLSFDGAHRCEWLHSATTHITHTMRVAHCFGYRLRLVLAGFKAANVLFSSFYFVRLDVECMSLVQPWLFCCWRNLSYNLPWYKCVKKWKLFPSNLYFYSWQCTLKWLWTVWIGHNVAKLQ